MLLPSRREFRRRAVDLARAGDQDPNVRGWAASCRPGRPFAVGGPSQRVGADRDGQVLGCRYGSR